MLTKPRTRPRSFLWLHGVALAASLFLPSCDVTHQLQVVSAAYTGCAPEDIEITDDEAGFNSRSWVAWCNSKRYQCFGAGNTANCTTLSKPVVESVAEAPNKPQKRPGSAWVTHVITDCGVRADFPGTPKDEVSDLQTKAGAAKLPSAMFVLAGGKGETSVACTHSLGNKVVVSSVLDGARDGMLKSIGGSLREEREVVGGREVLFDVEGEQGVARFLWLNNRVVIATAMPLSAIGPKSAKRFISSVQLTEKQ